MWKCLDLKCKCLKHEKTTDFSKQSKCRFSVWFEPLPPAFCSAVGRKLVGWEIVVLNPFPRQRSQFICWAIGREATKHIQRDLRAAVTLKGNNKTLRV